jgi:CRP-like cAMP-binding protein
MFATSSWETKSVCAPQVAVGERCGSHSVLYHRGEASSIFTLVLQGRALVWAGEEAFQSELGPWSCMGNAALRSASTYYPDFSAATTGACRLLRIDRAAFEQAAHTVSRTQEARAVRFSGSFNNNGKDKRRSSRTQVSPLLSARICSSTNSFPLPCLLLKRVGANT